MSAVATQSSVDQVQRMEELGRIILAYSEVTERLQQSHDQLMQQVVSLREELSEKNQMLERRNRLAALGEMAAGLAHEIRNPLGGIQLYASVLAKDLVDYPPALELVRKISGGVKRLEGLVSQTLQFSREIQPTIAPMDLADVVRQAVELAAHTLEQRNVVCRVEGPQTLIVAADGLLIGQVVLNLLLNAAEAIEGRGEVTIRYSSPPSESNARQFHLVVRDTGPGIPPAIIDRIFNPFFTTKDTGTGLGLAIIHRVVEAHEGTIIAANGETGGGGCGARFEVRI